MTKLIMGLFPNQINVCFVKRIIPTEVSTLVKLLLTYYSAIANFKAWWTYLGVKEMATSAKDKFHDPAKAKQFMNKHLHLKSHNQYQNLQELSSVDEFRIWYNVPANKAAHDRIQLWFLNEYSESARSAIAPTATARDIWFHTKAMIFENHWANTTSIMSALLSLKIESQGNEFFNNLQKIAISGRHYSISGIEETAFAVLYRELMSAGHASSIWATNYLKSHNSSENLPDFAQTVRVALNAYQSDASCNPREALIVKGTLQSHNYCGWKHPETGEIHKSFSEKHTQSNCRAKLAYNQRSTRPKAITASM